MVYSNVDIAMQIQNCVLSYFMISYCLLLTDVLIDPDVGSADTEMLGEGRPSATEK